MELSREGFPADIQGVRAVDLETFVTWVGRGAEWSNVGLVLLSGAAPPHQTGMPLGDYLP